MNIEILDIIELYSIFFFFFFLNEPIYVTKGSVIFKLRYEDFSWYKLFEIGPCLKHRPTCLMKHLFLEINFVAKSNCKFDKITLED